MAAQLACETAFAPCRARLPGQDDSSREDYPDRRLPPAPLPSAFGLSARPRPSALVAQWIEHRFPKPGVAGSIPAGGTMSDLRGCAGAESRIMGRVPNRVPNPTCDTLTAFGGFRR